MIEVLTEQGPSDRLVLNLDPRGPVEVADLTASFAALARIYERHYRTGGEPAPRLFITKLQTGSIIAEIAPYLVLLGTAVAAVDTSVVIGDFSNRLTKGVRAFADPSGARSDPTLTLPSREDASDLREFLKPLAGRKGATLGIKHARYLKEDRNGRTEAEYTFDAAEIDRATINIGETLEEPIEEEPQLLDASAATGLGPDTANLLKEVVLIFEQASRRPGREKGRTGDRGIIAEVSPYSLPVYFRKSFQNLKDQMVKGEVNPLTGYAFVVDVHVTRIGGKPKAYNVMNVHQVMRLDDDE